jgi:hypothetical protein
MKKLYLTLLIPLSSVATFAGDHIKYDSIYYALLNCGNYAFGGISPQIYDMPVS